MASGSSLDPRDRDLLAEPLSQVVDIVRDRHHAFTRLALDRLGRLAARIVPEQGDAHPELIRVRILLRELTEELRFHMRHEEEELFPRAVRVEETLGWGQGRTPPPFVPEQYVGRRTHEHTTCEQILEAIREATNEYHPFEGAPPEVSILYAGLHELTIDLRRHFAIETEVLFPRALLLEQSQP